MDELNYLCHSQMILNVKSSSKEDKKAKKVKIYANLDNFRHLGQSHMQVQIISGLLSTCQNASKYD